MTKAELQIRTCMCCRQQIVATQMMRMVVDEQGLLWADVLRKAPGRGVYLCMEPACLKQLGQAKRLLSLRKSFPQIQAQQEVLSRLIQGVEIQTLRHLTRLVAHAAIGRDAVMHKMWQGCPLFVFVSKDAGQALRRQLSMAIDKRSAALQQTQLIDDMSDGLLAQAGKREKISVMAVDACIDAMRLQQFSIWLNRMKDAG